MSNDSWYTQGYGGLEQEEERMSSLGTIQRLFIPPDSGREIVFLDSEPFAIYEHQAKIGTEFRNYFTCLKSIEDDVPCCEKLGVKSRYLASFFTVIDCTQTKSKDGNKTYQYEVKFLPAKFTTAKLLKRKNDEKGLAGKLYKVYRTDKKAATVGNEFTYERDVDLAKLFMVANFGGKKLSEIWTKASTDANAMAALKKFFKLKLDADGKLINEPVPFNYHERLKPMAPKDLRLALKNATVEEFEKDSTGSTGAQSGADTEVPF